ncbi:MAG: NAD(P)/FAD-dependent oxidoreductase [Spirochaeta sp.]
MKTKYTYVIVGAGAAGVAAARVIRERDPQAPLLVISNEDRLPYHRTQLSKHIAEGFERDQFALEGPEFWQPAGLDLITDVQVIGIDIETRTMALSNGNEVGFDTLLLATGGRPRLPNRYGIDTDELTVLRSAAEAEALIAAAGDADSAVVTGDGVLAIELTDQLARRNLRVVLGTRTRRLMANRLTPRASELLARELTALGAELQFGSELVRVEQNRPGVPLPKLSVSLGNGKSHGEGEYNADIVIAAYGIDRETSLAELAGISTQEGILVDDRLCTSAERIYAAGDCAQHPDGSLTGVWRAADAQGTVAGLNMIGENTVWENPAFRLKFKANDTLFCTISVPERTEAYELVEFEQKGVYQGWYCLDGRVRGVVMVNDPDRMQIYEDAVRDTLPLAQAQQKLSI